MLRQLYEKHINITDGEAVTRTRETILANIDLLIENKKKAAWKAAIKKQIARHTKKVEVFIKKTED